MKDCLRLINYLNKKFQKLMIIKMMKNQKKILNKSRHLKNVKKLLIKPVVVYVLIQLLQRKDFIKII